MLHRSDSLDRLTQDNNNNGTVSYAYNDVGLRTNMTVTGENTVFCRYDNANRLTNVTRTKFTAREEDGTGLYYYRARYFHAGLGRFASEDPIGDLGGPNLYEYVGDDPTGFYDPLGLAPFRGGWLNPGNWLRGFWTGSATSPDEVYQAALDGAGTYLYCRNPIRGGFGFAGRHWSVGPFHPELITFGGWTIDEGWNAGLIGANATGPRWLEGAAGLEGSWSQSSGWNLSGVEIVDVPLAGYGVGQIGTTGGNLGIFMYKETGNGFFGGGVDLDFSRLWNTDCSCQSQ
jgi:RHS repeat-associated protein